MHIRRSSRQRSTDSSSRTSTSPKRQLSISHITNTDPIFRSTFLGASIPTLTSRSEMSSPPCVACEALSGPIINDLGERRGSLAEYKRHAVILPTRHHGAMCRMALTNPLARVGEAALTEWERKGSMSSSTSSHIDGGVSASRGPSPATTPVREPKSPGFGNYAMFPGAGLGLGGGSIRNSVLAMDSNGPASPPPMAALPATPGEGRKNVGYFAVVHEEGNEERASAQFLRLL